MKTKNEAPPSTGVVDINTSKRQVRVSGRPVKFQSRHLEVLKTIMAEPSRVFTFEEIGRAAFKRGSRPSDAAIDEVLVEIRNQLTRHDAGPGYLALVWGVGVKFYAPPETITVRAFHVPSARFESGPASGEISPPNELVEPVWQGEIEPSLDDLAVCEAVFTKLNQDDRPNGHFAPSLSVGDVVTLRVDTDMPRSFQVDSTGFIALKHPVLGFEDSVEMMLSELDGEELAF